MIHCADDEAAKGEQNNTLYDSLPANAQQYYHERTTTKHEDLYYKLNPSQRFWRNVNLLRLYPLLRLRYLNSNELCCAIVNGEHRIYNGPGFHWVVGTTDRMVRKVEVGDDIDFGPIKIIFVSPGTLKFARLRSIGRPLLLGPGMHYFNDMSLVIGGTINMNFKGDNQVIPCDTSGAFSFVFVKTGAEGIVIGGDGGLFTLRPGLHFIEAPDSLKTFVSVQQEHFRFGTCDANQCFLTADNIELHINATIFYRIVDVKTMFTTRIKDNKDLVDILHSQAMATLLTIIRSEDFQGIGNRTQVGSMGKDLKSSFILEDQVDMLSVNTGKPPPLAVAVPSAPANDEAQSKLMMGFQNIIHDAEPQFQRLMQANFGLSGIDIQSLRIEQIEFADKSMQKQVSEFAMTNTRLTSQQLTIQAQRAIRVAEAERDAATMMIASRAEADKKLLLMEAENKITTRNATAEAENRLILADAEARAKLRIGEVELLLMEKQNAMPNAQLRIFTDAQKAVLQGVVKVVYTDQQSLLMKPFLNQPDLNQFLNIDSNTSISNV